MFMDPVRGWGREVGIVVLLVFLGIWGLGTAVVRLSDDVTIAECTWTN